MPLPEHEIELIAREHVGNKVELSIIGAPHARACAMRGLVKAGKSAEHGDLHFPWGGVGARPWEKREHP